MSQFVAESEFKAPLQALFSYHARPGALDRLLPPWQKVAIARRGSSIDVGTEVVLALGTPFGFPIHWHAKHTKLEPPFLFEDIQTKGPMKSWTHQHRFEAIGNEGSRLIDSIDYRLPLGSLGSFLGSRYFKNELVRMFRYRHQTTRGDVELFQKFPVRSLRIGVSGANGFVGSNLVALLSVAGHQVIKLTRNKVATSPTGIRPQGPEHLAWSPRDGLTHPKDAEGLDAVIHLAGKGIGDHRWSHEVKREIRDSRVLATEVLAKQLSQLDAPPKVFIACSAIGYYGNRGDEALDEQSSKGEGFLADVCEDWEKATKSLSQSGTTRVAHTRLGIVLAPRQGALAKLLGPIAFGLGGKMGSGEQYWSWISITDCISAIYHLLMDERATGPFNLVSPAPARNKDFIQTIAQILHRPAFLPAPQFALEFLLGEMAKPLLFDSCRAYPGKLEQLGYSFRHPSLESAVRYLLGL
jgi:hypothetical protein